MKAIVIVCALLVCAGCGVTTKVLEVEREDQVVQGNQGYLVGDAPAPKQPHSKKRRILEVDVTRLFDPAS